MRPFVARRNPKDVREKLVRSKPVQKQIICFAVAFNLLLWPGPGLVTNHVLSFARQAINARVG
ncbi:MAG: hypothetical protein WAV47_09085, partial [Blastocatellia bacterium]